jgi:O-antigen/teichoic acid export membrane protein
LRDNLPAAVPVAATGSGFAEEALPPGESSPLVSLPAKPGARRGAAWVIAGYGVGQVLRLGANVLLSRLLFPEVFGLMSLVMTLLVGLEMFSDIGVGPSIIQNPRGDDPLFLDTTWTLQAIRGVIIWLFLCLFAWPMAWFYNQPLLLWLVPSTGFTVVLNGLSSTSLYTVRRHLQLGRLTLFELCSQLVGVAVSCLAAWMYASVTALVAGGLAAAAFRAATSHFALGCPRNRFRWDPATVTSVLVFGRWIFVCSLITFLASQSDRLILGKMVDESILGVYSVAVSLATLPQMLLTALAMSLVFPVLSNHSRKSESQMDAALKPIREAMLTAGLGMILGVFVESDLLFRFAYDVRYQMAIPIVHWMLITVWISILGLTLDPALISLGDSQGSAIASLARFVVTIPAVILGFYVSGLWGFIAGLWIGGLVGQLALTARLRRHQIRPTGQDVRYTVALVVLILIVRVCRDQTQLVAMVVPQLVLVLTLGFVLFKLRWLSSQQPLGAAQARPV